MQGNSSGFTLVEIVIVLLLLGIVLATAVPSMDSAINEIKLDGAAREVVSAIQYVRSCSIKEGTVYGVEFHPDADGFECYDTGGNVILNPINRKPYVVDLGGEGHLHGVEIISANFGAGTKVEFNSLGEPSSVGMVVLRYGGLQKTVTVSAPLGRITVQ